MKDCETKPNKARQTGGVLMEVVAFSATRDVRVRTRQSGSSQEPSIRLKKSANGIFTGGNSSIASRNMDIRIYKKPNRLRDYASTCMRHVSYPTLYGCAGRRLKESR